MFDNIIYILATLCLFIGSSLSFNKNDIPSYFFVIGSGLFLVKSIISFIKDYKKSNYDLI